MDLWRDTVASLPTTAPYFFGQIDTRGRDWLSIEIEPRDREEVSVTRYDGGRRATEVWMGFHALAEFDENVTRQAFAGFPRDPEIEGAVDGGDDDDWNFRDFGLPARTQRPTVEHWTPRARVQRTDADLALEGDGDASATAAIVVEALVPLAAVRVQMSQLLEVTDVRWRPEVPDGIEDVAGEPLLGTANSAESAAARPDEPAMLSGEPVHFVQAEHDRRVGDDLHEPWLTVLLPRMVEPGERFIVEMAYEGELVEQLRSTRDFLLRDTVNWLPRHPDNRLSRFGLTFRVPDQYRVTSGGTLVDDRVEDGTRIMRWVTEDSVHDVMAFHYGRFDVSTADAGDGPPLTVYANRDHLGFAPGNREQTLETLRAALQAYSGYFGPYPFRTLTVTETPAYGGQAFPGLVLLSFEAFGDMNSDEAAFFRAHEVAHQWWGASVNWEDYRDQWISEGFAHYSAALFVLEARDARGEFDVMMETWRRDILSEVTLGTGTGIARYGLAPALVQRSDGHESGPVVAGYRLATPENPMDYQLLAYEKGAFILHMLRAMLTEPDTDDDARFRAMMLGFATDHAGGVASTVSFEAAVEAAVGEPVDWFFDQWVYGTDVPTYRPDLEIVQTPQANAPFALRGTIVQEDVPPGFRMPVPITLTFDGFPARTHIVWVDAPEVMVDVPLPARPTDIEFNSGHAVLARVR